MSRLVKRLAAVGFAATAVVACEEGGTGSLNSIEKAQLASALTNSGSLGALGPAAAWAPFAVTLLADIGSLGAGTSAAVNRGLNASLTGVRATSYEGAIGVVIVYNVQGQTGTFTGVVGWDGFTPGNNATVAEIVSAGAVTVGSTPIGNVSTPIGSSATNPERAGYATYFVNATQSSYVGTSGTFTVSAQSFGTGSSNCGTGIGGANVTCSYSVGTMSGSFSFAANRLQGSGPSTYTQSTVNFSSLPSVRMTITVN